MLEYNKLSFCMHFESMARIPTASAQKYVVAKNVYEATFFKIQLAVTPMTGAKKGVSTLIKGKNPLTLSIHCLAHRLALASEKACKQIPYMVKYLEIVNRLGKLCKFSQNTNSICTKICSG
jgi:hypothetical protein